MKSLAYAFGVILLSLTAVAAPSKKARRAQAPVIEKIESTRNESTATLSEALPKEARSTVYKSSVKSTYGTIVNDNNYSTGDRLNALELRPSFEVATKSGDYGLEMPITWVTSQGKQEVRIIGRPTASSMFTVGEGVDSRQRAGLSLKAPLADTSVGAAEMWRVWQIAPRFEHDARMGDSQYRFQFAFKATYDTAATQHEIRNETWGRTDAEVKWERGSTVGGRFGLARESGTNEYGAGLNLRYGVGQNHISSKGTYTSNYSGTTTNEEYKIDFNPMEMSWLDVYGKFNLGGDTALLASLQKTIRYELSMATLLGSYDELATISSLGISVGLSKSF
ncbi:MAG: hypothetical protein ABL958_04020 [Bdellovibrionia bacterium]